MPDSGLKLSIWPFYNFFCDLSAHVTMLDSLGIDHELCYQQVCDYPKAEAVNKLKIDPQDFKKPACVKGRPPIQNNNYDCNVHCLYCIKHLYENPDRVRPVLISPQAF